LIVKPELVTLLLGIILFVGGSGFPAAINKPQFSESRLESRSHMEILNWTIYNKI